MVGTLRGSVMHFERTEKFTCGEWKRAIQRCLLQSQIRIIPCTFENQYDADSRGFLGARILKLWSRAVIWPEIWPATRINVNKE